MKINKLHESIFLIQKYTHLSFKEFVDSGLVRDGICKRLDYSVKLLLDIAVLIENELKIERSRDITYITENLVKYNVINKQSAEFLRKMKALRNVIIYNYSKIDDNVVYEIITEKIDEFRKISDEFNQFMNKFD